MNAAFGGTVYGMFVRPWLTSEGALPYELYRDSQFALVAAERVPDLPAGLSGVSLVARGFDASADLMPRMFELLTLSKSQSAWVVEELDRCHQEREQPPIGVLLRARPGATTAAIVQHLRLQQVRSFLSDRAWLRVHDPYVFPHLPRVLGRAEFQSLMGPIDAWSICVSGQWFSCQLPPVADDTTQVRRSHVDLGNVWAALLRIGAVNRALLMCGWTSLAEMIEHSEHLDALVQRAELRHGLHRPQEQAAFATLGAGCEVGFDEHPEIVRALARFRKELEALPPEERMEANALDALQALPEEIWTQVKNDRPRPRVGEPNNSRHIDALRTHHGR
jgi:hypothetical protein